MCRTNSFDLSLNGRDFLVDDSVSLTDLGIVNGDLIYVVPNTLQPEEAQSSQPTACSSSNVRVHTKVTQQDHLVQHAGSSAEVINYYNLLLFIFHSTSCIGGHVSLGHQAISYSLCCLGSFLRSLLLPTSRLSGISSRSPVLLS